MPRDTTSVRAPVSARPRALGEIFATSSVVVSAPATLEWSGPWASRYGGVGMASALGPRLYVGIEPTPADPLELVSLRHVQPDGALVDARELEEIAPQLASALAAHEGGAFGGRCRIRVVSLFPLRHGLQADSAIATALAAALHLVKRRCTAAQLEKMLDAPARGLWRDPLFTSLFRLAWAIEHAIVRYRPDGLHTFAHLVRSPRAPVIYWRCSTALKESDDPPEDPIADLAPGGLRLTELPGGKDLTDPCAGLDIALVSFGSEVDSSKVYHAHRTNFRVHVDEEYTGATGLLRPLVDPARAPRFAELATEVEELKRVRRERKGPGHTAPEREHAAPDVMMDLQIVESVRTFRLLHEIAQHGTMGDAPDRLMRTVRRAQDAYRLLGLSSGEVDAACAALARAAKARGVKAAVRLIGPGYGGAVMIVARQGKLQPALAPILEAAADDLRHKGAPTLRVLWSSAEHGYSPSGQGIRVEPGGRAIALVTVRTCELGRFGEPEEMTPDEAWERLAGFDVVFDGSQPQPRILVGTAQLDFDKDAPKKHFDLVKELFARAKSGTPSSACSLAELGRKVKLGESYDLGHLEARYLALPAETRLFCALVLDGNQLKRNRPWVEFKPGEVSVQLVLRARGRIACLWRP